MTVFGNRIRETTTSTGTGDKELGGAASALFLSFVEGGIQDGDLVQYEMEFGAQWECVNGRYNALDDSITPLSVENSSNNNLLVDWPAGTKTIRLTPLKSWFNDIEAKGLLAATAVQPGDNVSDLTNDSGFVAINDSPTFGNLVTLAGASPTITFNETANRTWNLTDDGGVVTLGDNADGIQATFRPASQPVGFQAATGIRAKAIGVGRDPSTAAGEARINGWVELTERADPSNPANGFGRFWLGTDGKLYFINDALTKTDLTSKVGGALDTELTFNNSGALDGLTGSVVNGSQLGLGITPQARLHLNTADTSEVLLHLSGSARDIGHTGVMQIGTWDGVTWADTLRLTQDNRLEVGGTPGYATTFRGRIATTQADSTTLAPLYLEGAFTPAEGGRWPFFLEDSAGNARVLIGLSNDAAADTLINLTSTVGSKFRFFKSGTTIASVDENGGADFGGNLSFAGYGELTEQADPTAPAAGKGRLWARTDGKLYWRDDTTIYELTAAAGSGAPTSASYVTLGNDGTLTSERVLTQTANQVLLQDNGAGGTVVLSTPQDIHSGASPTFTNLDLTGTEAIRIPAGPTLDRPGTPLDGDLRINTTDGTTEIFRDAAWRDLETGGGSGEVNTASNIGTNGVGVFDQKVVDDLQFRNIASTNALLTVALDAIDNDIDLTLNETSINHDALSGFVADEHIDWTNATDNLSTTGTLGGSNLSGSNTGDVSLVGTPDYLTIAGQTITRNPITLTTDVTGDLPLSNLAPASVASVLFGRGSAAGGGDFEEIALGTNLSMSGTTLNASGGGGGSAIILDLGDDGTNESTDLTEIATSGDTNSIFSMPAADKLLINAGLNWPTSDLAVTATTANNLAADGVDAIGEIAQALRSGLDNKLITGTAGVNGNVATWDINGDLVDGGSTPGGGGGGLTKQTVKGTGGDVTPTDQTTFSDFTAAAGNDYLIDVASINTSIRAGNVIANLPAAPNVGDRIRLTVVVEATAAGSFSVAPGYCVEVNPGAVNIEGVSYTEKTTGCAKWGLLIDGEQIELEYIDATIGWRVIDGRKPHYDAIYLANTTSEVTDPIQQSTWSTVWLDTVKYHNAGIHDLASNAIEFKRDGVYTALGGTTVESSGAGTVRAKVASTLYRGGQYERVVGLFAQRVEAVAGNKMTLELFHDKNSELSGGADGLLRNMLSVEEILA